MEEEAITRNNVHFPVINNIIMSEKKNMFSFNGRLLVNGAFKNYH